MNGPAELQKALLTPPILETSLPAPETERRAGNFGSTSRRVVWEQLPGGSGLTEGEVLYQGLGNTYAILVKGED